MNRRAPAACGAETASLGWLFYPSAALSFLAASIHLWVTPEHYLEWPGYAAFFLIVAGLQGISGIVLLRRPGRWVAAASALGNLAVVLLWAYIRAVEVPLGPIAGEAEKVGTLDLVCSSAEVALIVLLVGLLKNPKTVRMRRVR